MTESNENRKKAADVGRDSPANEEAKQQGLSGAAGAREAQVEGSRPQPPQGSDRGPAARHQQPAEVRKGFESGHAPSEQGEKEHRSPEMIAREQQGMSRQSGSHAAGGDRSEEVAQEGAPDEEHTRHGRQKTPGTRPGHRTS